MRQRPQLLSFVVTFMIILPLAAVSQMKDEGVVLLRVPTQAREVLKNKVSNVEFFSSNYGIFGLDVFTGRAGGIWPRGSGHNYIFGGGIWFGARKIVSNVQGGEDTNKLHVIGYNPNSGASWMVPGQIGSDLLRSPIDESPAAVNLYRLYLSTDYNSITGVPTDPGDASGPNWPIWDTSPGDTLKQGNYLGYYVSDIDRRDRATYPKGPAIISGEDIFSTYKDTDFTRYEKLPRDTAIRKGYPIGLQAEQTIYSWGFGAYGDMLFIRYQFINRSQDNLLDCYIGPSMDMDIGTPSNDRARIAIPNPDNDSLNLAVQWSDAETSGRYGYVGVDLMESPAVNPSTNYLRKDKRHYEESEQLGVTTFQSWPIEEDKLTPETRYDFMAAGDRDNDPRPFDSRFMMTSGPFNMRPGDTARFVVAIIFANGKGNVPNGTWNDMQALIDLDRFAQEIYRASFSTAPGSDVIPEWKREGSASPRLSQNLPNPFGGGVAQKHATVGYSLPSGSHVSLVIYNSVGEEVDRQEMGYKEAGTHQTRIDGSTLPSGSYIYELRTSDASVRRTMVIVQ